MSENNKIDGLRALARQARQDEENTDSIISYYEKILLEEPTDWEAYFFNSSYKLTKHFDDYEVERLDNPQYYSMVLDQYRNSLVSFENNLNFALTLIRENVDSNGQREALEEVLKELFRILTKAIMPTATINYVLYSELGEYGYLNQSGVMVFSPYIIKVQAKCFDLLNILADQSLETFNDEEIMIKTLVNIIAFNDQSSNPSHSYFTEPAKKIIESIDQDAKEKLKPIVDKKVDEYWASQPNNKEELLEKKEQLKQQKKDLELQMQIKGGKELKDKQGALIDATYNVKYLKQQYNELGFYQGKQKKVLQQKINDAENDISSLRKDVQSLLDSTKPIKAKIDETAASINKIQLEIESAEKKVFEELHDKYQL